MASVIDSAQPPAADLSCRDCVHFEDDPVAIEARLPHIAILGSAYSSTRGSAGFCLELDRFHDPLPAAGCRHFRPKNMA
jgi:hypothetical protein